jgi:hypothetical protein
MPGLQDSILEGRWEKRQFILRQVITGPSIWAGHSSPEVSSNTEKGHASNDVIFLVLCRTDIKRQALAMQNSFPSGRNTPNK